MGIQGLLQKYLPMTEATYYVLLSLSKPRHGYAIMQHVEQMSQGRLKLGPGTLYGILSKMESEQIIQMIGAEEKRKTYELTQVGRQLVEAEIERLQELYENGRQEISKAGGDQ